MQPQDWITLAIAIWGALLSTLLAYYQWRKDSRQVYLDYVVARPGDNLEFSITNIGHRPIAIDRIGLKCFVVKNWWHRGWEDATHELLLSVVGDPNLPKTLQEGQRVGFEVPDDIVALTNRLNVTKLKLLVYEVTGKEHNRTLSWVYKAP